MFLIGLISLALGVTFLVLMNQKKANGSKKLKGAGDLRALQQKARESQKNEDPLSSVQPGAILSFSDVGLTSENFDAEVLARHLHKEGRSRWLEIEAERGGAKVYLTIANGDSGQELSLSIRSLDPEELELPGELDSLAQGSEFSFEGTTYCFSSQGRALYCAQEDELHAEAYEYWEFEGEDEEQLISLVRYADGSVEANYEVALRAQSIIVYGG